jgi:hypothetical protein
MVKVSYLDRMATILNFLTQYGENFNWKQICFYSLRISEYENHMKVDWPPNKMLNLQFTVTTFFVGLLSAMLVTSVFSTDGFTSTIMASGANLSAEEPGEDVVHIVRDSMASYSLVNNETEFVGTFDTTYSILGNSESLMNSHDAIISMVQNDFTRSPTIGYIKAGNSSASSADESPASSNLTLPNPFADSALINQTISQTISKAIESVEGLDIPIIDIKCDFDANIEDWKCMN